MRRVVQRKQFRDDLKRQKRRGKDVGELFDAVELLVEERALPSAYGEHKLSGEWRGVLECHIDADWLLIYSVTNDEVLLIRTGSHADLFT
jgi:mRNA interferase YafQ